MPATKIPRTAHLRALPGGGGTAPVSDEAIIRAFEEGDPHFGAHLYDRVVRVVEGTLFRVMGTRSEDHEDLVQSAFEQIVRTLAQRRFARACSLSSWAAAVTTRVALNAIRGRRTRRKYFDGRVPSDELGAAHEGGDAERSAAAKQALERLRFELSEMSEKKAEALVLHDVLGHELSEISVLTGSSVAAAQSRLVRGRRELAERMRRYAGEEDPA